VAAAPGAGSIAPAEWRVVPVVAAARILPAKIEGREVAPAGPGEGQARIGRVQGVVDVDRLTRLDPALDPGQLLLESIDGTKAQLTEQPFSARSPGRFARPPQVQKG
jgi:hypothetical protein